jgi:phosphate:Na+ symporter
MEAIGSLIGGIGTFFVGLHLLGSGLKQMAGRRFRQHFARWIGTPFRAGVLGFAAGFLVQSMSALSFIIGSLVGAGMLPVRRGMLVMFWGNAGVGIMIILAVLNIKVAVLFILGLAGLSFAFKTPRRMEVLSQALFGGAMLFYGLIMLRAGAEPLAKMPWFEAVLASSHSSFILAFLAGALLTALCQSSTAVSILAIALTQVGLFTMEQAMMIIYGTNVGSGAVSWLLAATLRGTPKQLVMSQVFFNFIAGVVFVILFYLEVLAGLPLVRALVQSLGLPLEQQVAIVYVIFNWGGAIALTLLLPPFAGGLERVWPATQEEEWSRTVFLHDDFGGAPELDLGLLTREQTRLVRRLPQYSAILLDHAQNEGDVLSALHTSFQTVSKEIIVEASALIRQPLSQESVELLMTLQNKQKQLDDLELLLHQFIQICREWTGDLRMTFQDTFIQSLDFLLHTVCEAEVSSDDADIENLIRLTQDKGEVLQSIRAAHLRVEADTTQQDRTTFVELTGLFERIVWTLGRIAKLQSIQKPLDRPEGDAGKEDFRCA